MAIQKQELMTIDSEYTVAEAAPPPHGMVMPLASAREAQAAITAYEQLKSAIVRPDDIQRIQGRDFLKKSFWRRVAACFGLSLELVTEERIMRENGVLAYSAIYRAIAPNGRTMTGDGYCDTVEKRGMPEHNIRAIAHTRAKNRAISDLVGGGEVSAEEMPEDDAPHARQSSSQQSEAQPAGQDRYAAALGRKEILDLLIQRQRFTDADRRTELESVFAAIEAGGQLVNMRTVKQELQQRLIDLSGMETGAPGN